MSYMIVVDATCDLPKDVIQRYQMRVMPFRLRLGETYYQDNRDDQAIHNLYQLALLGQQDHVAESVPPSEHHVEQFMLDHVVAECDTALLITISGSRSQLYHHASNAILGTVAKSFAPRRRAERKGLFNLSVLDSEGISVMQGLIAIECAELLKQGKTPGEVMQIARDTLIPGCHGYLLPNELRYLYTRAKQKGENTINWGKYMMGTLLNVKPFIHFHQGQSAPLQEKAHGFEAGVKRLFEHAQDLILRERLLTPRLGISYSGDLENLKRLSAYGELKKICESHQVELVMAHMSMSVAINAGANTLGMAYIAKPGAALS